MGALNLSGADLANAQVNLAAGAASFTVGGVSHSQVELGGTAWTHGLDGLRDAWSRLRGPGHPTWKLGTAAAALAAVALLLVSVPDRVTASVAIEGQVRQIEIASTEAYRVALHMPDRDIARVHRGQSGALRLTGQPERSIAFAVTTVTAIASEHEGVNGFRVEAAWHGEAPHVSPGMQGVGKVEVGRETC